ncbi:MAG: HAD-IA family hydrolase [Bacteroidota bacterium]
MPEIHIPEYIKGLIFDCDGTLVDSMPVHMMAWEHSVKSQGGAWDFQYFFSKKGMPDKEIIEAYNAKFGASLDLPRTMHLKDEYFRTRRDQLKPIPPVVEIVHRYRTLLPMAVASGSTKANVDLQLDTLGIKNCFNVILTADDGIAPKPSPDIFLKAASRLGIAPGLCQVFEDGDLGLEAARRAGMYATDVR